MAYVVMRSSEIQQSLVAQARIRKTGPTFTGHALAGLSERPAIIASRKHSSPPKLFLRRLA